VKELLVVLGIIGIIALSTLAIVECWLLYFGIVAVEQMVRVVWVVSP
jgi:hypothetical protein